MLMKMKSVDGVCSCFGQPDSWYLQNHVGCMHHAFLFLFLTGVPVVLSENAWLLGVGCKVNVLSKEDEIEWRTVYLCKY